MEVWVNQNRIEIFSGARVKNALLKHSKELYESILSGEIEILDKRGHQLDLEGALTPGSQLFTKETNKEES